MSHASARNDSINRISWGLSAIAATAGAITIAGSPVIMPRLFPAIGTTIYQFDPAFLTQGALVVVGLWVLNAMLFAVVFSDGCWRPLTRALDLALTTVWAAALLWLAIGPRIFTSPDTDNSAKGAMFFVLFFVVISTIQKFYRAVRG